MTKEKQFIIRVLSDYILKKKTEYTPDLDWEQVFETAKTHQVSGIVYSQCKEFINKAYSFEFLKAYAYCFHSYENRLNLLNSLNEEFKENGIDYFVLKGTEVANFFPCPQLRTMGDTDIVVKPEQRAKAGEIMLSQGFENESDYEDKEWVYVNKKLKFELHDSLVYEEVINDKRHERFFGDFWNYVQNNELEWNFHFLFLILHLRKHFMNSGVGFRQFMDIAVLAKYNEQLDWVLIEQKLKELGLFDFAKMCFAFCEKWFGVPSPLGTSEIDNDFYEESTEIICANGIFGFDNDMNNKNDALNHIRKEDGSVFTMIHLALAKTFPPYRLMISEEHYSFLKGKPFLLPFAWIYRFFRGIKYRKIGYESRRMINDSFVSKDYIKQRTALLEKWGL